MSKGVNSEEAAGVRAYYNIPDSVSDDEVMRRTAGSLGEAIVRLNLATNNISKAFAAVNPMAKVIDCIKMLRK